MAILKLGTRTISPVINGIVPTGTINLTNTNVTNVKNYANAQVVDSNLVAGNIKNGVTILGTQGTYQETKYGCNIDNLLGNVNASGVLQYPTDTTGDIVFTGVTDVSDYALENKFYRRTDLTHGVSFPNLTSLTGTYACKDTFAVCNNITSASLPLLTTISGSYSCYETFSGCYDIASLDLSSLTTISGNYCCYSMFNHCISLTSLTFPSLTSISSAYACYYMFTYCSGLTSVSFPSLTSITGSLACTYMFSYCTALTDIYFNALTTFGASTNQFSNMMSMTGSTTTHTLHFPSNLESLVNQLNGYPTFGGTSGYVTCSFDLPATS